MKRCVAIAIATAASSAVSNEDERQEMARAVECLTHLRLAVLQRFERHARILPPST